MPLHDQAEEAKVARTNPGCATPQPGTQRLELIRCETREDLLPTQNRDHQQKDMWITTDSPKKTAVFNASPVIRPMEESTKPVNTQDQVAVESRTQSNSPSKKFSRSTFGQLSKPVGCGKVFQPLKLSRNASSGHVEHRISNPPPNKEPIFNMLMKTHARLSFNSPKRARILGENSSKHPQAASPSPSPSPSPTLSLSPIPASGFPKPILKPSRDSCRSMQPVPIVVSGDLGGRRVADNGKSESPEEKRLLMQTGQTSPSRRITARKVTVAYKQHCIRASSAVCLRSEDPGKGQTESSPKRKLKIPQPMKSEDSGTNSPIRVAVIDNSRQSGNNQLQFVRQGTIGEPPTKVKQTKADSITAALKAKYRQGLGSVVEYETPLAAPASDAEKKRVWRGNKGVFKIGKLISWHNAIEQ